MDNLYSMDSIFVENIFYLIIALNIDYSLSEKSQRQLYKTIYLNAYHM